MIFNICDIVNIGSSYQLSCPYGRCQFLQLIIIYDNSGGNMECIVHVRACRRYRFGRWESVRKHTRSCPNR